MKHFKLLAQRHHRWISIILFLLFFSQLLSAATQLSATIDEGFHIISGYEYLRTGEMRLFDEHPPLAKALFAWPLFFVNDLQPPEQAAGWNEGDLIEVTQTTLLSYQPIDRALIACRIPVALLALLLVATTYHWAVDMFGPTAGLFTLALLTFDPNLLAHGSLATTDIGATAFIFWSLLAFARYMQRPTKKRWGTAALFLGLAQGVKLTALLLFPLQGLLVLLSLYHVPQNSRHNHVIKQGIAYAGMVVLALMVLWALYGFEVRPLPEIMEGDIALPAASHIARWLRLQENLDYGREAFLLGQNQMHGWWQYFPIAFAIKTPIPVLLLMFVGLGVFVTRQGIPFNKKIAILLFPLLYGLSGLTSTINIGYRHLLPTLPFLYLCIASIGTGDITTSQNQGTFNATHQIFSHGWHYPILCVLLIWQIFGTSGVQPHYLAFFNEIAGGVDDGWRFLADSNTDWGQSFKALAAYQEQNLIGPVKLSTFTFLDPAIYGVNYKPIAPMHGAPPILPRRFNPESGYYAISATTIDGVPLPYPPTFDWFRHREPLEKIGHVMFLYKVQPQTGSWVAQCTNPVTALSSKSIAEGFGIENLREITFDCEQSWIIPEGGEAPGWYTRAIPGEDKLRWPTPTEHLEWWPDWVSGLALDDLKLSYVQPTPGERPPFAIWEYRTYETLKINTLTSKAELFFLGFTFPNKIQPADKIDVLTYWLVTTKPDQPLSFMLHLRNLDGTPIAVGDGIGVSSDQWQPGDLIIQRHILTIPPQTLPDTYEVVSGAYLLYNMSHIEINGVQEKTRVQITQR